MTAEEAGADLDRLDDADAPSTVDLATAEAYGARVATITQQLK